MEEQLALWQDHIKGAKSIKDLDHLKAHILGKAGVLTLSLKELGSLSPDDRKEKAILLNDIKNKVLGYFESQYAYLNEKIIQEKLSAETLDLTLPSSKLPLGTFHPLTILKQNMKSFFEDRGFVHVVGPEIEDEWHNFDALNIPEHHPARQSHDTFYIQSHNQSAFTTQDRLQFLLRTHTSTVQIRALKGKTPPLRLFSMGRVYRSDALDATHTPMFHQTEGVVIDQGIHMGHLKGFLHAFCAHLFDLDHPPLRWRPSFFPFTEPSAEIDIAYTKKDGKLIFGEGENWMEILGCGMIHPTVLENCGIDSKIYQGFAFGLGLERLCMLQNGMTDIRQFYEGDESWSAHFGRVTL